MLSGSTYAGPGVSPVGKQLSLASDQTDDVLAVRFELPRADAGNAAQRVQRGRAGARDFPQRGIVEDDVSRNAVAARRLHAPGAQALEQRLRRPGERFPGGAAYARGALWLAPAAQRDAALAAQHRAAFARQPQRAIGLVIDLEQAVRDALPDDRAPFAAAALAADAEGAQLVVVALYHLGGGLAAQHVD